MGLLQAKWALVGHALATPKLSAGDCAVLWQLCDRYNEQAGAAWPSMTRLASDISRDRKTVQRSLARLEAAELVQVTERGSRTRSNRYRPSFPRLGAQAPEGRGVDAPRVEALAPPESIHEPGYQAGVNGGVPSPADAGSGGGAGAALEAQPVPPSGRQFPAFWSAYPKATGVYKAEQAIESILASGQATLSDLARGARAYAAWVQAQPWADKAKYTKGPANWLAARGWLDDYPITKKQAPPDKQAATPKPGATPQATARPARSPEINRTGYTFSAGPKPKTRAEAKQFAEERRVLRAEVQSALAARPSLRRLLQEVLTPRRLDVWLRRNPGNIASTFTDEEKAKVRQVLAKGAA
jgi:hypothetical protein